jgi:hypothetical protein
MPRLASGDDPEFIKSQLIDRRLCERNVTYMGRIKRTAENTDPGASGSAAGHTQSRRGRKWV